jgi:hypothetical protein
MANLPGSKKRIAMGIAPTFGTPISLVAGMGLEVDSFDFPRNTTELTTNAIGGNTVMKTQSEEGDISPAPTLTMAAGYQDASLAAIAQFFGADTVSTVAASYHRHRFTVDEDFNDKWITLGAKLTTTEAVEAASCAVTRLAWTANVNQYLSLQMDMLANERDLAPTPNTAASLEGATVDNIRRIVVRPADTFAINAQGGGALNLISDKEDIVSLVFDFSKPQEHVSEIRGAAGLGEPESAAGLPMIGTVTATFKDLETFKYYTAQEAGTEYKATLDITGPIATGSSPYRMSFFFPRLKVVNDPSYSISSAGRNPFSVTFEVLKASANPTGMVSTYPYVDIYNLQSASYF